MPFEHTYSGLCIGGPHDGKRYAHRSKVIECAEQPPDRPLAWYDNDREHTIQIRYYHYHGGHKDASGDWVGGEWWWERPPEPEPKPDPMQRIVEQAARKRVEMLNSLAEEYLKETGLRADQVEIVEEHQGSRIVWYFRERTGLRAITP